MVDYIHFDELPLTVQMLTEYCEFEGERRKWSLKQIFS